MKIIVNTSTSFDQGMFWSNEDGWIESIGHATQFSDTEHQGFNLPLDGKWIDWELAEALVERYERELKDRE